MPRKVEEWDRRHNRSVSLSDYHVWVIDQLTEANRKRDRSQVLAGIIEDIGQFNGFTVEKYLTHLWGTEVKLTGRGGGKSAVGPLFDSTGGI